MNELAATENGVVRETRAHLEALRARHPGAPKKQMVALYLLGLEREQIVAVSYHEDTLRDRIEELDVDEGVRDVVRYAMRWIWKEEQMHAIFIRGALLLQGGLLLRARAFVQQLMGAIAGWATSVLHHVPWKKAPISRFWANVFTLVGVVLGKVPRPVLKEMRQVSFRDYCRFSLSAEHTAALCWQRVGELAEEAGEAPEAFAPYQQMATDENHHGRIFAVFLEAFDESERLLPDWDADRLAAAIADIGEFYLPPARRPGARAMSLGRGGRVAVGRGGAQDDKSAVLTSTLADAGFAEMLAERAKAVGKPVRELTVAIKPAFMRGYSLRDASVFVDPELVRGLAVAAREVGCRDVAILESACIYAWYFANRDVRSVARYLGYDFPEARLVDVAEDSVPHRYRRGMAHYQVAATWRDADVRIAFGKLASHPVDQLYLSLAQLEGLGARQSEFVFVDRQAHRGQAAAAMIGEFPPHFALIDAYDAVSDGLLGVIACPHPKRPRRIYAGQDAIAVDLVASRHVGEDPRGSSHLSDALQWFDDPSERIAVVGCDELLEDWTSPCHNEVSAVLSFLSYPVYLLLSGRGSLFMPEMDLAAFPPIEPPSVMLRGARGFMRWLLGTRLPPAP